MTHNPALVEEFFTTMGKVHRIIHQFSNVSVEDKVATMLQLQALTYLKENPKATVGALAQTMHMSSPAIAQFTDRLVHAALITRTADANDRRIVRLSLTKKGEEELGVIHHKLVSKMSAILEYISEKDLQEMIRIHKDMLTKLEAKKQTV